MRYLSGLPQGIRAKYERAMRDPELLSSAHEVGLLQVRVEELSERLYGGESGSLIRNISEAWDEFREANRSGDAIRLQKAAEALEKAIAQGSTHEQQWRELRDVVKDMTMVKAVEWKRLHELEQLVSVEQIIMMFGVITQAIHKHVRDRTALQALTNEISRLITLPEKNVENQE